MPPPNPDELRQTIQQAIREAMKPFKGLPATEVNMAKLEEMAANIVRGYMPGVEINKVEMQPNGKATISIDVPAHLICGSCGAWLNSDQHADECLAELAAEANRAAGKIEP